MNFVNKLISRILALVCIVLVLFQTRIAFFDNKHDVRVLVFSIIFLVLVVINLAYQIVLFVKNFKKYDNKLKGNDCTYNLIVSASAVILSVLDFILAYNAYLYLI